MKRVWDSQDGVSHIDSRMAETIGGTSLVLHWRKQDPGSSFPRSFLNYMTQPSTTQVLALPARSEQYGLFLTPNDWTITSISKVITKSIPTWIWPPTSQWRLRCIFGLDFSSVSPSVSSSSCLRSRRTLASPSHERSALDLGFSLLVPSGGKMKWAELRKKVPKVLSHCPSFFWYDTDY